MRPSALIAGAGPAGLSAAVTLADSCDRVLVVDARPHARRRRAGEHLPPAALTELAQLGLGELLDEPGHGARHEPSPGVRSAWGDDRYVDKEYYLTAPGRGLNLAREAFDAALVQRARSKGVDVQFATRLRALHRQGDGFVATISGPGGERTVRSAQIVDATGRAATPSRLLGATRHRADELIAIVGRITACRPLDEPGRVLVESAEHGWWYGVQFASGEVLAAFMTDSSLVRRHARHAHGLWLESLPQSRLLGPATHGGRWNGRVELFDACAQHLEHQAPAGFVAVGDAAAAFDPLSSWGITKGLRDGRDGALALEREHAGDPTALDAHRRAQRRAFDDHRTRQQEFYRAEQRWPTSPFWRARQRCDRATPTTLGAER